MSTWIDIRCRRCNGILTGSYLIKDGDYYHGDCLVTRHSQDCVDTAVNIARLTAQVAELKAELDRQQEHHMEARRELQEQLTAAEERAAEKERDENLLKGGDVTCLEIDRPGCGVCPLCLGARIEFLERCVDERRRQKDVAEDRVRVLEMALRDVQQWADTCLSIGATNAGLRRIIGKCDDAINAPAVSAINAGVQCDTKSGPCACGAWHGIMPMDWARGKPDEMLAPTDCEPGEICEERLETAQCDHTRTIDRLRAGLAAEKKRVDDYLASRDRLLSKLEVEQEAHAATRAEAQAVHESRLRYAEARDVDLAETRAALAKAEEENARLRSRDGYVKSLQSDLERHKAALGRAVEALRKMMSPVENGEDFAGVIDFVSAILADPDGKAASEAYAEVEEFIAASLAQERFDCPHYEPPCDCAKTGRALDDRVEAAWAKVKARRGA